VVIPGSAFRLRFHEVAQSFSAHMELLRCPDPDDSRCVQWSQVAGRGYHDMTARHSRILSKLHYACYASSIEVRSVKPEQHFEVLMGLEDVGRNQ
jgi:hypothetical protein